VNTEEKLEPDFEQKVTKVIGFVASSLRLDESARSADATLHSIQTFVPFVSFCSNFRIFLFLHPNPADD